VENQLQDPDFPEVKAAIERLEDKGLSRHAARACVTRIFTGFFNEVLSTKKKFDEDRYKHQLRLLGTDFIMVGRNEPCPCGSGLKFKRCCMDMADDFKTSRLAGALCLGHGIYIIGPHESIVEEPLDPILQLENRGHIAGYLEEHGDIQGARRSLEENVALAESYQGGKWLMNALQDLELLCMNHRSLGGNGIIIAERLMALAGSDDERGNYWCGEPPPGQARGLSQNHPANLVLMTNVIKKVIIYKKVQGLHRGKRNDANDTKRRHPGCQDQPEQAVERGP
jgi:hypothetical protein